MKKIAIIFIVLLLAALSPAASAAAERGYETPEACAQALFTALQAQDVEAMDGCIAFAELAAGFNFQAQAERLRSITAVWVFVPPVNARSVAYNELMLRQIWYRKLEAFQLEWISPALVDALFRGMTVMDNSDEYAEIMEALEQTTDLNIFALLTFEGIVLPEDIPSISKWYYSEKNLDNLAKLMNVWDMDTYTEFGIEISTVVETAYSGDARYIIPLRFVQIDGLWLVDPNASVLGMLLGMGSVDFVSALPD